MSRDLPPKKATSAGGVIVKKFNNIPQVLLIRNRQHNGWMLPKGHVEPGETIEQAAMREVLEEAGIHDVKIIKLIGTYQRFVARANEDKTIHYFLMLAGESIKSDEDLSTDADEIRWHPLDDIPLMYLEEQKDVIKKNRELIKDLAK